MRRSSLIALAVLVVFAVGVGGSVAARANGNGNGNGNGNERITICHATGNGGYVQITISINGLNGHEGHADDIIPPNDKFPSKNWDAEGQAIWENGCVVPPPPEPPKHPIGVFATTACGTDATTYSATFGYTSENDAAVTIPVGADNFTAPGSNNQGQPTTFQPGTVSSAFTVTGIPAQVTGTWSVTYGGETRTATVSQPSGCNTPPPPKPSVTVSVTCVDKGATTYTARFGYTNPGATTVSVPTGSSNGFSPAPTDRGQPIAFEPGTDTAAVEVTGIANGSSLKWTVKSGGKTSSATATSSFGTACTTEPPPVETKPVTPFVKCVDAGATTYTVTYGYSNPNSVQVPIAVGTNNRLDPAPQDRGQPSTFAVGTVDSAFTVTGVANGTQLVWLLNGKSSTASSSFPTRCTDPPPLPPEDLPVTPSVNCVTNHASTYDIRFGYENDNDVTVEIPVGSDNRFSPGQADQGQPTLFAAGTVDYAFTVEGVPNGTALNWIVAHGGVSHTATASASFQTKCVGDPIEPPIPPDPPDPPEPPIVEPPPVTDQAIGVFVTCVTPHGSTYDATFGYQNDNSAPVTIAVGSSNGFSPAPQGRGQVTEFLPGNQQQAFTVTGISAAQALTWSVTHAGATRSATASATLDQACNAPPPTTSPIGLFACVTPKGSTYDVTFGYDNENTVAVSVPVGISNGVLPQPISRGQPEIFVPGRVTSAFTVKNVPESQRVTWRVAHNGTTLLVVSDAHPVRCGSAGSTIPVRVFPLCILKKGNTYDAAFGYLNSGTATIRVKRGEQNAISPESHSGNQTEVFRPGLSALSFAVRGVKADQKVTWTVETHGQVETATASASTVDCTSVAVGGADLSVTKVASPTTAAVGDRIQYSIAVHNNGTILSTNVVAVDRPLDALVKVMSATTSQGSCTIRTDGQVVCRLGTMGPGQTVHIVIAARAAGVGSSRDTVRVLSVPRDADRSNNTASAVVTIGPASGAGSGPSFTG